jgi:hypothetical protein
LEGSLSGDEDEHFFLEKLVVASGGKVIHQLVSLHLCVVSIFDFPLTVGLSE